MILEQYTTIQHSTYYGDGVVVMMWCVRMVTEIVEAVQRRGVMGTDAVGEHVRLEHVWLSVVVS